MHQPRPNISFHQKCPGILSFTSTCDLSLLWQGVSFNQMQATFNCTKLYSVKCSGNTFCWKILILSTGAFSLLQGMYYEHTMLETGRQKPKRYNKFRTIFIVPTFAFFGMFIIMEVENRRRSFSESGNMKQCVQLPGNMRASCVPECLQLNEE